MMRLALSLLGLAFSLTAFVSTASAQELRPVYTELGHLGPGGGGVAREHPLGRFILFSGTASSGGGWEMRLFDRRSGGWSVLGPGETDYAWSPRGDRLAFAKADEEGQVLRIWTLPLDPRTAQPSGPPRRVSTRTGRGPAFSPDGRSIAFTVIPSTDTVAPRIAVVPVNGGPDRILVQQTGWAQQLRWSPDGKWIYYRHAAIPNVGGPLTLSRVPASGGPAEVVREIRDFIDISRDGQFLSYIPADATDFERIPLGIATAEGIEIGRFTLPRGVWPGHWAASGWKILAIREENHEAIHAVSLRGGPVRALSAGTTAGRSPSWSPDGRLVAFSALLDDRYQLMLVNAAGGARRQVPTRAEPDRAAPVWSPDGRYLAFLSTRDRERALNVVEIATGAEARLASAERIDAVAWRRDSRGLIYVGTRGSVQEVREVTLGSRDALLRTLAGEMAGGTPTLVGDSMVVVSSAGGVFAAPVRESVQQQLFAPADGEINQATLRMGVDVSRDGRWAALPVATSGGGTAIRLIPLAGGSSRVVSISRIHYWGRFLWHPDGRHLLVVGTFGAEGRPDVLLVPLNGDPPRALTAGDRSLDFTSTPAISPDGSAIVYSAVTARSATLWELDLSRALAPFAAQASPR